MTDHAPDRPDIPNEIVAAAHEHSVLSQGGRQAGVDRSGRWPLARIGLGVSIGSAAIAAAVLFATRGKDGNSGR